MNNNTYTPGTYYLVSGTRRQVGAIGKPESFQEEIRATSAHEAYVTIFDSPNYEHIHVIAIKMRCLHCGKSHVTVPPDLYVY